MLVLFWILLSLIAFIYFGYPLVIWVFARIWGEEKKTEQEITSFVTMIIPVHNEEKVIRDKAANVFELEYPKDKLEVLFALDGCTDRSKEILTEFESNKIKVLDKKEREGKVKTLNKAVPKAKGEIIVFSDANSIYKKDALKKLVRNFYDKRVGCACGRLKYLDAETTSIGYGENLYWKYETFIKIQESRLGKLLITNGSIQAVKKDVYPYPDPEVADDFSIPLLIMAQGHKVVYDAEAVVYEKTTQNLKEEINQKVRIVSQGIKGIFKLWKDLIKIGPLGVFELLFHKVLRWVMPFFLFLLFLLNLFLLCKGIFLITFLFQIIFYFFALGGYFLRYTAKIKLFYIPFYFCLVNSSAFVALWLVLKGRQTSTWEKADSTRIIKKET